MTDADGGADAERRAATAQATGDPAPVVALAVRSGRAALFLDLSGVRDKQGFMAQCAADLALPDWFGRNWDALADCLTDLSWVPAGPGRLLVVSGWAQYAREQPRDWAVAREVLAGAAEYWRGGDTPLTVLLTPA